MPRNLDYKVTRDTIFMAPELTDGTLEGWGSFKKKFKKKFKKVASKVGRATVPSKIRKKASKFESKNRKKIKKVGAIAAIAVATYFAGPAVLKFAGSQLGGGSVASSAAKKFGMAKLKGVVSKKMSKRQRRKMKKLQRRASRRSMKQQQEQQILRRQVNSDLRREFTPAQAQQFKQQMKRMTPGQVLQHPVVTRISRNFAARDAMKVMPGYDKQTTAVLAKEGAFEVENQSQKKTSTDWLKIGAPVAGAALVAIIAKS